jgi:hydroxyacylglutathione hydrolase
MSQAMTGHSQTSSFTSCGGLLHIQAVAALEDNYFFVVWNVKTREALIVDTPEAKPALHFIQSNGLKLKAVFNTHHHWDHIGANRDLLQQLPALSIYGNKNDAARITGINTFVTDGQEIEILGSRFLVKETPGHTRGHIVYILDPQSDQPDLFCGDTLFGYGCGKLFEGTFEEMLRSLAEIRHLPDATRVWCAHEYTEKNLFIATQLEPENGVLKVELDEVKRLRANHQSTIPLNFGKQKRLSPFLRWDDPVLRYATQTTSDLSTFRFVREFRDRY